VDSHRILPSLKFLTIVHPWLLSIVGLNLLGDTLATGEEEVKSLLKDC
jgi:hypothetical protein